MESAPLSRMGVNLKKRPYARNSMKCPDSTKKSFPTAMPMGLEVMYQKCFYENLHEKPDMTNHVLNPNLLG